MSKTKSIEITNLKAISDLNIDFNGCSAIVIGGNNKGKSTFLKSIPDRIRGIKPSIVVKDKEVSGTGVLKLDSGERFEWEFDKEGKDKVVFFTKEGYKTAVTKEISKRFFPPLFDIDEFLNSQPKEQNKQLQKLLGVDFTDIDLKYKAAYDCRTEMKKEADTLKIKLSAFTVVPEKVEKVDVSELIKEKESVKIKLNARYIENKKFNDTLRKSHEIKCDNLREQIKIHNEQQSENRLNFNSATNALNILKGLGYIGLDADAFVSDLGKKISEIKVYEPLPSPEFIPEMPDDSELKTIDEKINSCQTINSRAVKYDEYAHLILESKKAYSAATEADKNVKEIEGQKKQMLLDAKLPDGIEMTDEGIFVDGFPLNKNQIATSKLYCTALRLASLGLGEVKTLHFDASSLDNVTLLEIEKWSNDNGLQLLIERVDMDGGDIKYEILETINK